MDTMPKAATTENKKSGGINKVVFAGLFLPVAALVVVIGLSLGGMRMADRISEILESDGVHLQLVSGFLGAEILSSLKHLRAVAAEAVTREALEARSPAQLRALQDSLLTLARRNPLYQQVRWIDETGMEQVRISRAGDEPVVVAAQDLQDKSGRYYFQAANEMLFGELYISRVDLNEEQGRVEMPPRPVLRIATPVAGGAQQRRGILIINIDMKYLFEFVHTMSQADPDVQYYLINQQGMLLDADLEADQATQGPKPDMDFAPLHPGLWEQVQGNDTGSLEAADGLWTWRRLSPVASFKRLTREFTRQAVAFDQLISDEFSLMLVAHRSPAILDKLRRESYTLIALAALSLLAVYGLTLYFYLNGQARARRAEVEAAYARARAASLERMNELEERFHRLVEASSIGQVVVDEAGRIEIANPAAERMLGYDRDELVGLSVDTLLPEQRHEQHRNLREQFMQAPETRQMGAGRELAAVRKDGSVMPVEVGLNPYLDHGRQLVLASIIDLSARQDQGAG
jgi:PAS domain S-box-containing protein